MNARKATSVAGVVAVAMVAAAISYDHQQHLAATHGQSPILAAIWPLCTDGMIASCAAVVATDRAGGYRPRTWAVSGFWLGVAVSILTNWLATSGGLIAHGVSAFPALAFLITIEALSSRPRLRKVQGSAPKPEPVAPPFKAPAVKPTSNSAPPRPSRKAPPSTTAAVKVAAAARKMPTATAAEIAALAKVSESTARRHLASTNTPAPAQTNGFDVLAEAKL